MKSIGGKDIAEFVGFTAIVASLIFVGLQLKQSQEIAIAETFLSILSSQIEATTSINENAEIWAKANSGAELSAAEYVVFTNIVATLDSVARISRGQLNRLGHESAATGQLNNLAIFLHRNPVARQVWAQHTEIYNRKRNLLAGNALTRQTTDIVLNRLEQLDQAQQHTESK